MTYTVECNSISPDPLWAGNGTAPGTYCKADTPQEAADIARRYVYEYRGAELPRAYVHRRFNCGRRRGQSDVIFTCFQRPDGEIVEQRFDQQKGGPSTA